MAKALGNGARRFTAAEVEHIVTEDDSVEDERRHNEVLRENVAKLKARVADLETVWYEPDAAPFIIDVYLTLERGGKRWVATGYKLNRSSVWYDADSERPLPEGVDVVAWAHIRKPAPMEAKP